MLEITKEEKVGETDKINPKFSKDLEIRNSGFNMQDVVNHVIQNQGKLVTISTLKREIKYLKVEIVQSKEDIRELKNRRIYSIKY